MDTQFFEVVSDQGNWGKFMVGRFTDVEWARPSAVEAGRPLMAACGWGSGPVNRVENEVGVETGTVDRPGSIEHVLIVDMQTGEGGMFIPGGLPRADLQKHGIWVCPMFELFLEGFYNRVKLVGLDAVFADPIKLFRVGPEIELRLQGHRHNGPRDFAVLMEKVQAHLDAPRSQGAKRELTTLMAELEAEAEPTWELRTDERAVIDISTGERV